MKLYLSENIKEYRLHNKMTQKEFGELLGVSPQAVSKWENKMAYPDLFLLPIIAEQMKVSIDELMNASIKFS